MAADYRTPADRFVEPPTIDLSRRYLEPERMDSPELAAEPHRHALAGLRRINYFSRSAAAIAAAISRLPVVNRPILDSSGPLTVLDLGCGGGDVAAGVHRRLRGVGIAAEVTGWDRSETAVEEALRRAGTPTPQGLRFAVHDAFAASDEHFDVVYCSLFLHHFEVADAVELLRQMKSIARRAVIVDDLLRSQMGYLLASAGCRLLSRSDIVHFDGPQSVRAAFTRQEVNGLAVQAGLSEFSLRKHWPERFTLTWCRG